MEYQRTAEVQRLEEVHDARSSEAHDEIAPHKRCAAAREEGVKDMIVDVPACREEREEVTD